MRRTRRIRGLMDRKSLDDAYRSIHLRNIRINYSLNHEWEQLNWEIWVCVPQKSTNYPFIAMSPARRARAKIDHGARAKIDLRASREARNSRRRFRIPKRFLFPRTPIAPILRTRPLRDRWKFCARSRPPKWLLQIRDTARCFSAHATEYRNYNLIRPLSG